MERPWEILRLITAVLFAMGLTVSPAVALSAETTTKISTAEPAIEGLLDAFRTKPLVGIGDAHGVAQELDFYSALVSNPRFAREVGNVVVEFGSSAHQSTMDRYVAGDAVPYLELRKVWTDTVGWFPLPGYIGYMNFFSQVRETNRGLPPDKQIHVWLGEPAIDWSKINTRADWVPFEARRDSYPAGVIGREILEKHKKALVIYGGAHLVRDRDMFIAGAKADPRSERAGRALFAGLAGGSPDYAAMVPDLGQHVREQLPTLKARIAGYGQLKSVSFKGRDMFGEDQFEFVFTKAKVNVGISITEDGKIQDAQYSDDEPRVSLIDEVEAVHPDTFFVAVPYVGLPGKNCTEHFEGLLAKWPMPALVQPVRGATLEKEVRQPGCPNPAPILLADSMIYLGPASSLTIGSLHPDIYLDEDYRQEVNRRYEIMAGEPLKPISPLKNYPVSPQTLRP
jgi:hypothetical protein